MGLLALFCYTPDMSFEPGIYVKGDHIRVVEKKTDAVQAVFDGYKLREDAPAPEQAQPQVDEKPNGDLDRLENEGGPSTELESPSRTPQLP